VRRSGLAVRRTAIRGKRVIETVGAKLLDDTMGMRV
jgi:hypothetical protein